MTGRRVGRQRSCLIIGQTNAGKTLFLINFAHYLGLRQLVLQSPVDQVACSTTTVSVQAQAEPPGRAAPTAQRYSVARAREELVAQEPHTTRKVRHLIFEFPHAKVRRRLALMDTAGITDGIHPLHELRQAMAATLEALMEVDITLHLVDVAALGKAPASERSLAAVDRQLAAYAPLNTAYRLLANKMDLPWARSGLEQLRQELPGTAVIPISARSGHGLREVKAFVWDAL